MANYYIHDGKSQIGPFTIDQLKTKALTNDTPIWYEGLEKWTTVANLRELKSLLSTPPPLNLNEQNENTGSYQPMMNQYFPPQKKKSLKVPLIILGAIIAIAIIIWLINKNNQNSNTISSLQTQVETQQMETEKKNAEDKAVKDQKDAEEKAIKEKNLFYRNNWEKYITFVNAKPTINYALGGISAFEVLVKNQTDYILDQVDVEVKYLRKNGEVWQVKDISFLNVPANSFDKQIASNSINGVEISVVIKKIISRKMNFCYPINNGNSADPFFCK